MTAKTNPLAVMDARIEWLEALQQEARDEGNDHFANELEQDSLREWREARSAMADLVTKIHDLGLLYEAGCDIDAALSELEQLASAFEEK